MFDVNWSRFIASDVPNPFSRLIAVGDRFLKLAKWTEGNVLEQDLLWYLPAFHDSLRIMAPCERAVEFGEIVEEICGEKTRWRKIKEMGGGRGGRGAHSKGRNQKPILLTPARVLVALRAAVRVADRDVGQPACSYGASSCCTAIDLYAPRELLALGPFDRDMLREEIQETVSDNKVHRLCARSRETRSLRFSPTKTGKDKGTSQKGGRPQTRRHRILAKALRCCRRRTRSKSASRAREAVHFSKTKIAFRATTQHRSLVVPMC